VLVLTKIT